MMRRQIRELVLRTNGYRPFRTCYGAIYRAAAACFVRYVVRNRRVVRSVYIRQSRNAPEWIPGLSDIDLTVILDAGLSPEEEYRALEEFWAAHRRLKTLFPMFGEVEILNQHEFGGWLAGTSYHSGPRAWTLVYGEPNANLETDAGPGWALRALRQAWWIYEDLLPPCVAQPASLVRNRDIQRRVEKILRLLAPLLPEAGQPEQGTPGRDPANLVANALRALERAAVQVLPIRQRQRRDGGIAKLIQSRVDGGRMLVIDDGLDREALAGVISKNSQPNNSAPLLLPRCLLEYRVRFYNPYDYWTIALDWISEGGKAPLEDVPPPREAEFLQYLLNWLRNLQVASRGEELFANRLSVEQLNNTLMAAAAIRLLWSGRVVGSRNEIWAKWAAEFPEYQQAVEKIGGLIGQGALPEVRRECFFLLGSIANQLGPALDAPGLLASAAAVP